jgi:hypothetical protein
VLEVLPEVQMAAEQVVVVEALGLLRRVLEALPAIRAILVVTRLILQPVVVEVVGAQQDLVREAEALEALAVKQLH